MSDFTEKELVGQFLLAEFSPGDILSTRHVEIINAAKARIHRQLRSTSQASQSRTVKAGGRPRLPDSEVTPNALAQRRWRAKNK